MTEEVAAPPPSPLALLSTGLTALRIKKQVEEPGYDVLGMTSFEQELLDKRTEYASELVRVMDELKLTAALLGEVDGKKALGDKSHEPEDLLNYYSGVFFDLVHQIKDKLLLLIDLLLREPQREKAGEHEESVDLSKFLKKDALEKIGIKDLLQMWTQEHRGPLGVVLRRRTEHHHYVSTLQINRDFLNVRMFKLLLTPQLAGQLQQEGRERMSALGAQAFEKFKKETVEKQRSSIIAIEANLEAITEKLMGHFRIPSKLEDVAKVAADYSKVLAAREIKNETSEAKMQVSADELRKCILECTKRGKLEKQIVATYLIGSAARGEMVKGRSDLTTYVLTKNVTQSCEIAGGVSMKLISEADFASEARKKDRFICWSDGLLLTGVAAKLKASDFPLPGALLALMLNADTREALDSCRKNVSALQEQDFAALRKLSLQVAKLGLDYEFGVAMTDRPFYSSSRIRRIEHIKSVMPQNSRTRILEQLYSGETASKSDLLSIIDSLLKTVADNHPRLLAIQANVAAAVAKKRKGSAS